MCACYFLLSLFYLVVFYGSMTQSPLTLHGDDPVKAIRWAASTTSTDAEREGGEGARQRDRQRETDRETDTDTHTHRQTDRHTHTHTYTHTHTCTHTRT